LNRKVGDGAEHGAGSLLVRGLRNEEQGDCRFRHRTSTTLMCRTSKITDARLLPMLPNTLA
jgi:hypothetical protein